MNAKKLQLIEKINKKKQEGAQLIELALVLPVLLLIIFAIIEYSILFGAQLSMNNAAGEAARRAMAYRAGQDTQFYIDQASVALNDALPEYIGDFRSRVLREIDTFECGDSVCLRIALTYPNYTDNPLVGSFPLIPLPDSLSSQAVSRIEPDVL